MATGSGDGDGKFKARFAGDRATAPTPLEDGSEHTWQEFVRLQTEPGSLTPMSSDTGSRQDLPPPDTEVTVESTMALARRSGRACPRPAQWQSLHALLPSRGGTKAAAPVAEKEWKRVSPMQKRLLLRDHLEWAAATGVLPAVHALLAGLTEADWDHF